MAGQGALGVADQMEALAIRLNAPVLTTPSARGIVCETHELPMGFDVLGGSIGAANALLREADAVIVLGAMYGRRPRCKRKLTVQRNYRVQPCIRPVVG